MIRIKKPLKSIMMEVENLLRLTNFFKGLSGTSIKTLAEICIPKTVEKKKLLFSEGQEGHAVYLLTSGAVQLFKTAADGRKTVIKVSGPGEIFGEVILFERKDYPVSARALTNSVVILIPRAQLHCLLVNEDFRNDFMRMMMKKQRYLTERILYLTAYDLEERFFRFLLDHYGEKQEYTLPLSKKDLASSIGTLPETLSRLLSRLEREKKIAVKGNIIRMEKQFWEKRNEET